MLKIISTTIAVVVIAGCTGNSKQEKETVASVLSRYSVEIDALSYIDEPPGKLKAVTFQKDGKRITLVLEYDPKRLFSATANWNKETVLSTTVTNILTEPLNEPIWPRN